MTQPLDPKKIVGVDPYPTGTTGAARPTALTTGNDPTVNATTPGVKQAYAPIPVQTYTDATVDPGAGSLYTNELDAIPAIYSRANVYVNQINQTQVIRNTNVDGAVTRIIAGDNITITSTGANGTGAVTVNSLGGSNNPFDQDLNTTDDVAFNSVATPLITTDQQNFEITVLTGQTQDYWIANYGDGPIIDQDYDYASSVVYDNEGNIIFFGGAEGATTSLIIVKVSASGELIWQKNLSTGNYTTGDALAVDSDNNLYLTGQHSSGTAEELYLIKLDSNGDIVWQNSIDAGNNQEAGTDVVVAQSGNIYLLSFTDDTVLSKFTNAGSLIWSRNIVLSQVADSSYPQGLAIDSSENCYVTGYDYTTSPRSISLVKIDASGDLVWQQRIVVPLGNSGVDAGTLSVDSQGFVYNTFNVGNLTYLLKQNPADGSIVWQKEVSGLFDVSVSAVAVDPTDNVYLGINYNDLTYNGDIAVLKFSNDGSILWQRNLAGQGGTREYWYWYWGVNNIAANSDGYSVTGYRYLNASETFISNLASDGSGIGTHGPFIYSEISLTVSNSSLTPSTPSYTVEVNTPTVSVGSYAIAAATKDFDVYYTSVPDYTWQFNIDGTYGPTAYTFPAAAGTAGQTLVLGNNGLLEWAELPPLIVDASDNIYIEGLTSTANVGNNNLALGANTGLAGGFNNYIGLRAGELATGGSNNNFIGQGTGQFNTTGFNNNFIGISAGQSNTDGSSNNFIGPTAGNFNSTGNSNNFIGPDAGFYNTTGSTNNFIGNQAGFSNTTGSQNQFIGQEAGYFNTTGFNNVFIGDRAGRSNNTSSQNTFVGTYSGYTNTSGYSNAFYGHQSGYNNASGYANTLIGDSAGRNNTTGYFNTSVGFLAGRGSVSGSTGYRNSMFGAYTGSSNTTGAFNTFVGNEAGFSNTTGWENVFVGTNAGQSNTSGTQNVFLGPYAGWSNTTGSDNIFLGYSAGYSTTGGYDNIALGDSALISNISGYNNVAIGRRAMFRGTGSNSNTAIGVGALQEEAGNFNVAVGLDSARGQTGFTGSGTATSNSFLGYSSGYYLTGGARNVALGYQALYKVGNSQGNIGIGSDAMYGGGTYPTFISGNDNLALGRESLYGLTSGAQNIVLGYRSGYGLTTGSDNVFIGHNAGYAGETGNYNIAIGKQAFESIATGTPGSDNIAIGRNALLNGTSGSFNLALGYDALRALTSGNNNIAIGNSALESNTTGNRNIAIGEGALEFNTGGAENVAIGLEALRNSTTGIFNTAVGGVALVNLTSGGYNVAFGYQSLNALTTASGLVGIGYQALTVNTTGAENTAIGYQALSKITTGNYSTAIGYQALQNNTANDNTAVGDWALKANTTGIRNVAHGSNALAANTTANDNTALGTAALLTNQTGAQNTAIGSSALRTATGNNNTSVGFTALRNVTTGIDNVAVGSEAGLSVTTGSSNTIIGRLSGTSALTGTVLIGAGATERIKVDSTGLYINGSAFYDVAPLVPEVGASKSVLPAEKGSYIRMTGSGAKTLTFNSANSFAAPQEYHVANRSASGDLTLIGTGITLNAPYAGSLVIPPGGTATVKFVSATEADVYGVTLP
jgi:hypothetical protein